MRVPPGDMRRGVVVGDGWVAGAIVAGAGGSAGVVLFVLRGETDLTLRYLAWALMPYLLSTGVLSASRAWHVQSLSRRVLSWSAIVVAALGPALYVDAVFLRPDAQGPLVVLMVPVWQMALSIASIVIAIGIRLAPGERVSYPQRASIAAPPVDASGSLPTALPAGRLGAPAGADCVVVRTSIPPEPNPNPHGPVGWAVAGALAGRLHTQGVATGEPREWHNGVRVPCRAGPLTVWLEITPEFDTDPLEWCVTVRRPGASRYLIPWWRRGFRRTCNALAQALAEDERFETLSWYAWAELTALRDGTRH